MTRTFLVPLELGTDMDFASVAAELTELIDGSGTFELAGPVHFWSGKETGAMPTLIPPPLQSGPSPQNPLA